MNRDQIINPGKVKKLKDFKEIHLLHQWDNLMTVQPIRFKDLMSHLFQDRITNKME